MRDTTKNVIGGIVGLIVGLALWTPLTGIGEAAGDMAGAVVAEVTPVTPTRDPHTAAEVIPASPTDCQADQMAAAFERLGERDTSRWQWADLADELWGLAFSEDRRAAVSVHVPCDQVASVVAHEWMHLRTYDTGIANEHHTMVNDVPRIELIADCGTVLLYPETGIMHTHGYIDAAGVGCTPDVMADARAIIESE